MKPILFDGHFGWLHLPRAAGARGAVLCKPPGHEAQWLHSTLLALAQQLSIHGIPTLIFDYLGTGDSLDDASGVPEHEGWLAGIESAVRYLREIAQVECVTLGGVRLGGTLAALAAQRCDADGLMLLAPVLAGRAYVREARLMQRIWLENVPPAVRASAPEGRALDLFGYRFDVPTVNWLETLDLGTLELDAIRVALAHPGTADAQILAHNYRERGAEVDVLPLPEYIRMLRPAWATEVPYDTLAALAAWAAHAVPPRTVPAPDPARTAVGDVALMLPDACEQTAEVGKGRLFGILCQPLVDCAARSVALIAARHAAAVSQACRPVVLIANTGGTSHVGEARFGVTLARHLASRGCASLRFDVAGIGDSPGRSAAQPIAAPAPDFSAMQADLEDAIDWLAEQGYTDVILFGICSGAYLSLQAARHPRVAGVVGVNLPAPVLPRGMTSLRALGELDEGSTGAHMQALFNWRKWRDVARGRVRLLPVLRSILSHGIGHMRGLIEELGGGTLVADARQRTARALLRQLDACGVRVRLLYTPRDIGLERLMLALGSARNLRRLRNLRVDVQPCVDHEVLGTQAAAVVTQYCERMVAEQLVLASVSAVAPDVAPGRRLSGEAWGKSVDLPWYAWREGTTGAAVTDLPTRK